MSINMNTLVTGGSVTVEDGLKAKEEFAPARKVAVTLNFSVPEGADGTAVLDYVSNLAQSEQDRRMYIKASSVELAPAAPKGGDKIEKPAKAPKAAKEPTDKEKLAAQAGVPATSTQHKGETPALVDDLEAPPAKKAEAPKDDLEDLLGDTPKPPVTDQELGKAAQEKNGKMKGVAGWAPEKIRALVGEFVQVDGKPKPGAKLQEIPAAQRHEFLKALDELK